MLVAYATDLSLRAIKCCSVVFGVTLRLLVTTLRCLFSPSTNTAAYYQRSVTTCGTVVRRRRSDNTSPIAALSERNEARYRLRIAISTYTQLYSPSKAATIKKQTKQKKKRNKPLQDKSSTTGQHNSILCLIFSTQSTNDIIGFGELAQKIRFSITCAHRRQRKIKHFHAAGRNFFASSIEYFHECAYNYIFHAKT